VSIPDFDVIIPRRGTGSLKYDAAVKRGKPADVLPFWVADMDFQSPPAVLEALSERVAHGIFGYTEPMEEGYFQALQNWYRQRFQWECRPEWLVITPGVVFALCAAIRALTQPGDAVLIQQPVYYPFETSIKINDRRLVVNRLVYEDGRYSVDLAAFERQIAEEKVKLFILCSPHNPVGRVWTREELRAMGDICLKHGVYVVADEIHADFVYPGHRHWVFAGLRPEYEDITVTCTAPSKTFNLPGLQVANIFIKNEQIRRLFLQEIRKTGYSQPNVLGLVACRAAYEHGAPWLEALLAYLTGNLALVRDFLREELPQVRLVEPEGTYLLWLDFRALGLPDRELEELLVQKGRIWLSSGPTFGAGGEGFQRLNIGCPRALLQEGLQRMKEALL